MTRRYLIAALLGVAAFYRSVSKRCIDCGRKFDPTYSIMGSEGQCQDCWEEYCNRTWWEYVRGLKSAALTASMEPLAPVVNQTKGKP